MPGGPATRRYKPKAVVAEEAARCLEMHLAGATFRTIAQRTGLATGTVQNRIKTALAAVIVPGVEEMRQTEGERLRYLLSKLEPAVEKGDREAIKLSAQLSASYRKLYGLNAPEAHTVQLHQVTQADLELVDLVNEMRAKVQTEEAQLREQTS